MHDTDLRSPVMRTIARLLSAMLLFSTTVTAAESVRGIALPLPPTVLEPETPIDWLASATLPALPDINTGGYESPLQLTTDIVARDGQVVQSLQPQLEAPSSLKGPSLNYIVATAPTMAGEDSHLFESGATTSRSWQVFANQLQQGGTYYWKAVDLSNSDSTEWASFTVDIHRTGVQATDTFGPLSVNLASGELTSAAGTLGVPTVAGQLRLSLAYSSARHEDTPVSEGWSLAGLSTLGYTQASYSANQDAITLRAVNGGSLTFVQPAPDGPWQAAPQGDIPAGLAGSLAVNAQGEVIYTTVDGSVSVFNAQGNLQSKSVAGPGADAQWVLQWSGDHLIRIIDPVSGRSALFFYVYPGNYQPAEGFDWVPPQGKLTRFINLDDRTTTLFYRDGRLARLEQTGGKVVDFAYDLAGRLAEVRSPEGADLDAHTGTSSDRRYTVDYFADGRVKAITSPAALPGGFRLSHHYTYSEGATTVTEQFADRTQPLSTVAYDEHWRTLSETNLLTDYTLTYQWAPEGDRVTGVTDSDGLQETARFDAYGRLTARYGPALTSQFGHDGLPSDSAVPATHNSYDDGIDPLVVRAWNQPGFAGSPVAIGTQGMAFNLMDMDGYSAGDDGWSAIVSTVLTVPHSGQLYLRAAVANNPGVEVTLVVSGAEVVDATTVTVAQARQDTVLPVTLLLASDVATSSGRLQLSSSDNGEAGSWQTLADSSLSAGLGLTTEQSRSEQLSSQGGISTLRSTLDYQNPVRGNLLSQTLDPGGLGLITPLQYGGDPYGRVTGQTLPSGMSSSFTYWDGGTTACAGTYTRSGGFASVTIPHATQANTAGRKSTLFYNASGQQVGMQVDNNPATCMAYDSRGRITSMTVPATGEAPAREVQVSYGIEGQLFSTTQHSTVGDVETAIRMQTDLGGRALETTDEWGTVVTTAYDDVNRQITQTTVLTDAYGQRHSTVMVSTFDEQNRLYSVTRDGTALVQSISYWYDGADIDYGNGTSLSTTLNAYRQLDQQILNLADNSQVTDTLSLSPSGRILGQALVGATGETATYRYTYDNVLRLSDASLTGDHPALGAYGYQWHYGFGAGGGANPDAGKDGAVSQETVTGPDGQTVTRTFSYNYVDGITGIDAGDQAQSMTVAYAAGGYNMTELTQGNGNTLSLSYDQTDQLVAASDSAGKSVTYSRSADGRVLGKVTAQVNPDSADESLETVLYSAGWALNEYRRPMSQTLALPGGVTVSIAADLSKQQWQYSSLQNHALLTTDGQGEALGELTLYSPYGEVLTVHPDTLDGAPDMGYDGASGVETETFVIDINLMGDRVYIPSLHSFTTLDPTFNGSTSPYNYANADPINLNDPTGHSSWNFEFWTSDFWKVENPMFWVVLIVVTLLVGVATGGSGFGLGWALLAGAMIGGGMTAGAAYNSGYRDMELVGWIALGAGAGAVSAGAGWRVGWSLLGGQARSSGGFFGTHVRLRPGLPPVSPVTYSQWSVMTTPGQSLATPNQYMVLIVLP